MVGRSSFLICKLELNVHTLVGRVICLRVICDPLHYVVAE